MIKKVLYLFKTAAERHDFYLYKKRQTATWAQDGEVRYNDKRFMEMIVEEKTNYYRLTSEVNKFPKDMAAIVFTGKPNKKEYDLIDKLIMTRLTQLGTVLINGEKSELYHPEKKDNLKWLEEEV